MITVFALSSARCTRGYVDLLGADRGQPIAKAIVSKIGYQSNKVNDLLYVRNKLTVSEDNATH